MDTQSTTQPEEEHIPTNPNTANGPVKSNGLGTAALVLGIIALVFAFVPFINYGSGVIGFIGLILGIFGLLAKNKPKRKALIGTIISAVAVIMSIVMAIAYTALFFHAVDQVHKENTKEASTPISIVYEITGDSTDATVTYSTYNNGKSGSEQATNVALPFSKTITGTKGGDFDFNSYTLSGMNGQTGSDITCKITVDGKVVSTQTSKGQYASVTCSASGKN